MSILDISKIAEAINNNKQNKGVYLFGTYGVGKTYAMQQLKKKLVRKLDNDVEFVIISKLVVWPEYISSLKNNMSKNTAYISVANIDDIKRQEVLIIDDIGGEMPSDWALREVLFPILNYRIDKKLITFFTSNFSISELESYYSKKCEKVSVNRVIDRIIGMTEEVELKGINHRRGNK